MDSKQSLAESKSRPRRSSWINSTSSRQPADRSVERLSWDSTGTLVKDKKERRLGSNPTNARDSSRGKETWSHSWTVSRDPSSSKTTFLISKISRNSECFLNVVNNRDSERSGSGCVPEPIGPSSLIFSVFNRPQPNKVERESFPFIRQIVESRSSWRCWRLAQIFLLFRIPKLIGSDLLPSSVMLMSRFCRVEIDGMRIERISSRSDFPDSCTSQRRFRSSSETSTNLSFERAACLLRGTVIFSRLESWSRFSHPHTTRWLR